MPTKPKAPTPPPPGLEEFLMQLDKAPSTAPSIPDEEPKPKAATPPPPGLEEFVQKLGPTPPIEEKATDTTELVPTISEKEFNQILQKYNITGPMKEAVIADYARMLGGKFEGEGTRGQALGVLSRALGQGFALGAPAFATKKISGLVDENMEAAMDELHDLIKQRSSKGAVALEIAGGVVPGLATGSATITAVKAAGYGNKAIVATNLALATAASGAAGLFSSKKGEELEDAATSAALGFGIGLVAGGVGAAVSKGAEKVSKPLKKVIDNVSEEFAESSKTVLDEAAERIAKTPASENVIKSTLTSIAESGQKLPAWVHSTSKKAFRKLKTQLPLKDIIEERADEISHFVQNNSGIKKLAKTVGAESPEEVAAWRLLVGDIEGTVDTFLGRQATSSKFSGLEKYKRFSEVFRGSADNEAQLLTARLYDVAQKSILKEVPEMKLSSRIRDFIFRNASAQNWLLREWEDKTKIPLVFLSHSTSKAARLTTNEVVKYRAILKPLYKRAKKAGLQADEITDLIESGQWQQLDQAKKSVIEDFINLRRDLYTKATTELKYKMKDLGDRYVRRQIKNRKEAVAALETLEKDIAKELGLTAEDSLSKVVIDAVESGGEGLKGRAVELIKDYVDGLSYVLRKPLESISDIKEAKDILFRQSRIDEFNTAQAFTAALERTSDIVPPAWLREKNIFKLYDNYVYALHKQAYMGPRLRELSMAAAALKLKGHYIEGQYLTDLIADINYKSRGSWANSASKAAEEYQAYFAQRAQEAKSLPSRVFYSTLGAFPEILHLASQQLYPSYMGLRVNNIIRNLTQPFTLTTSLYGYKNVTLGLLDVFIYKATSPLSNLEKELVSRGYLSSRQAFEAIGWLKTGLPTEVIEKNTLGLLRKGLDGLNQAAMYGYTKSDVINRAVTIAAGKRFLRAAFKDEKLMAEYLKKLPVGTRSQLIRHLKQNQPEKFIETSIEHALATTQFNYDRVSMAHYGRFLGGAFCMFTKWPTEVGGELMYIARKKGVSSLLKEKALWQKYWGPLIAFSVLDGILPDTYLKEQLVGDVSQMSPITSVVPHKGDLGSFFKPPVFDLAARSIYHLTQITEEGQLEKLWRSFSPVLPGRVYLNFFTEELDKWEKALEGRKRPQH